MQAGVQQNRQMRVYDIGTRGAMRHWQAKEPRKSDGRNLRAQRFKRPPEHFRAHINAECRL